jgi:2-C-methyl-D-erythritol 4-phosphate cytidylyltransferase
MPHTMKRNSAALIVAAGQGLRFQTRGKKQYENICGHSLLAWTIWAFTESVCRETFVIVVGEEDIHTMQTKLLANYSFFTSLRFVQGGSTRQESVYNGLKSLENDIEWVAIHDGVRSGVTSDLIDRVCMQAYAGGAAVAATAATDSTFIGRDTVIAEYLDRSVLWQAQTPQVFKKEAIMSAHEKCRIDGISANDDAFLYRACGGTVHIVESDKTNIKVTYPQDLVIMEEILKNRERCPE